MGAAAVGVSLAPLFFSAPWEQDGSGPRGSAMAEPDPLREEAIQLADRITSDFPGDPAASYVRGLIFSRFGYTSRAAECWQQSLDLDARFAPAIYCLGWDAFEKGDYGKCIEILNALLEDEPAMADAHLVLGKARMNLGQMDKAAAALSRYTELVPGSTEGHFRLGQAYLYLKQFETAKNCYQNALEVDPECEHAWYGLSSACRMLGQEEEAAQYLAKFRQVKTEGQRVGRGLSRGYDDQAALRQGVADAHVAAGKVYLAHGNTAPAEALWKRATELNPSGTEPRQLLASLYEQSGRSSEARQVLQAPRETEQ
jgi:tetratricopeptide (TPR) repeat protein